MAQASLNAHHAHRAHTATLEPPNASALPTQHCCRRPTARVIRGSTRWPTRRPRWAGGSATRVGPGCTGPFPACVQAVGLGPIRRVRGCLTARCAHPARIKRGSVWFRWLPVPAAPCTATPRPRGTGRSTSARARRGTRTPSTTPSSSTSGQPLALPWAPQVQHNISAGLAGR